MVGQRFEIFPSSFPPPLPSLTLNTIYPPQLSTLSLLSQPSINSNISNGLSLRHASTSRWCVLPLHSSSTSPSFPPLLVGSQADVFPPFLPWFPSGYEPDPSSRSQAVPIYASTSFVFRDRSVQQRAQRGGGRRVASSLVSPFFPLSNSSFMKTDRLRLYLSSPVPMVQLSSDSRKLFVCYCLFDRR